MGGAGRSSRFLRAFLLDLRFLEEHVLARDRIVLFQLDLIHQRHRRSPWGLTAKAPLGYALS